MQELNKTITIFQNFACTKKERLEFVQENVPKLAEIWGDYDHHINYNLTFSELPFLFLFLLSP